MVRRCNKFFLGVVLFEMKLMISWRGKRLCLKSSMAKDSSLKMNGWVVHMHQEIGVDLGNEHLEWHWGKHREHKYNPEGMVMVNIRTVFLERQCGGVPLVFVLEGLGRDIHW